MCILHHVRSSEHIDNRIATEPGKEESAPRDDLPRRQGGRHKTTSLLVEAILAARMADRQHKELGRRQHGAVRHSRV